MKHSHWLCGLFGGLAILLAVLGAGAVWVIHRLTFRITDSKQAAGAAALFALGSAAFTMYMPFPDPPT